MLLGFNLHFPPVSNISLYRYSSLFTYEEQGADASRLPFEASRDVE